MELHEKICEILAQKGISKREFANELIKRDVRSHRTGEVLSESIIYSYLSGATSIRAELLPHICAILEIAEQELFEFGTKKRMRVLKRILESASDEEKHIIKLSLNDNISFRHYDDFNLSRISELLIYAPPIAIEEMIGMLESYKRLYMEIKSAAH